MAEHPRLEDELRDLGRHLRLTQPPDAGDVARTVRARVESGATTSVRTFLRGRWLAAAAVVVLAAVLAGTPAGRAAVVEVLRFAGVEVRREPGPAPTGHTAMPGEVRTSLADARARAGFPVYVPAALGRPDAVTVSDGEPPRVVSLIYAAGRLRLDEFGGRTGPYLRKFADQPAAEMVRVGGEAALWVRGPHAVVYVDRSGQTRTESARLAGNTLIWQAGGVTLRLEGDLTRAEATRIAESVSR